MFAVILHLPTFVATTTTATPTSTSNLKLRKSSRSVRKRSTHARSRRSVTTAGRNSLRGFPFFQVNASVAKTFSLANERNLELKIEAINLLNNTNFADPNGSLGTLFSDATFASANYFGQSVGTYGGQTFTPFYLYGGPRSLQVTAKFWF